LPVDKLKAMFEKQPRKKMTGAKGPWKNMGSK